MLRPFLISTGECNFTTGGLIVLHKLGKLIRDAGRECYLAYWDGKDHDSHFGCKSLANNLHIVDPTQCIAIYPEITHGNPLNAKHVIRWLLNSPGRLGGPTDYDLDNEVVVVQERMFVNSGNISEKIRRRFGDCGSLTVIERFPEWIYGNGVDWLYRPEIGHYTFRKGEGKTPVYYQGNLQPLGGLCDPLNFGIAMRNSMMFLSYDTVTFLSLQAALCGALSIVVPDVGLSKDEHRNSFPFGVAYGSDDYKHAINTAKEVPEFLDQRERQTKLQVNRLLEISDKRFS